MRQAIIFLCVVALIFLSCKKYLADKPQKSLVVPSSLNDIQALLDNTGYTNYLKTPELLELVADDYYAATADWQATDLNSHLNYIWDSSATDLFSWSFPYQGPIYYANVSLDALNNISVTTNADMALWNTLKGTALFYRSFAFYQLAQLYCKPYSSSANSDLGIVLKLTGDPNEKISRSTVQQTYDQILDDLKICADLLPTSTIYPTRPNKAAAYGELARTYLSMRDYVNAGKYADLSLQQYSTLMDYNTISQFPKFNSEVTYFSVPAIADLLFSSIADSVLYNSYSNNDLRKNIFFSDNGNGTYSFNGGYYSAATFVPFDGITTDEMYLIRAECYDRNGSVNAAMSDLNTLMIKRWKTGTFIPFTATDANDAKNKILIERRKELVFRTLRWSDLRRLNLEGANITLSRIVNGTTYTLPPNDLRWVMLIPQEEISRSSIQQNPR